MAGIKIVDLPPLGRDLASTDLLELSLAGGTGSRKITGQEIMNASKLSINNTPIINGTVGRVLFQGTGNVLQQSSSLFWDNTNLIFTLGSTATRIFNFRPEDTTGAYGNSCSIRGGNGNGRLDFYSASNITEVRDNIILLTSATGPSIQVGTGSINLNVASSTRLQVAPTTGNVLIGTTTDAGFRLDVNGTARVQNDVLLTTGILATSAGTTRLQSVLNFFSHNRLGSSGTFGWDIRTVGTQNSFWRYNTSSGNTEFGSNSYGLEFYGANTLRTTMTSGGNWLINTTTDDGFRLDVNGTARVQGQLTTSVNQNNPTRISLTNTFSGALAGTEILLNTNSSALMAAGKVSNAYTPYKTLAAGDGYLYNTTFGDISLLNDFATGRIKFAAGGASTAQMSIFSTGNVGINTTTDAGFRLDVNGTARVSSSAQIPLRIDGSAAATGVQINSQADNDLRPSYVEFLRGGVSKFFVGFNYGNSGFYIGDGTNPNFNMKSNGNILIGTFTDVASSLLTLESTTKGFLPPRMTQAQRNAIASPAIGLEIYQTDATEGKYIYKSSGWTYIG